MENNVKEFKQNESKKHDEMQIWCFENIRDIIKSVSKKDLTDHTIKIKELSIEKPIIKSGYNGSINIIGYLDLYCEFIHDGEEVSISIEIKPEINSLGDLIRQVKTYKTHLRKFRNVFIVVSKTDKYKEILSSQSIRFFKYES